MTTAAGIGRVSLAAAAIEPLLHKLAPGAAHTIAAPVRLQRAPARARHGDEVAAAACAKMPRARIMARMAKDFAPPSVRMAKPSSRRVWRRYLRDAPRPLYALLFLLPWVLLYEIGAAYVARNNPDGRELIAYAMIHGLLGWFGIVGPWLPAIVLVAALLVWHVQRGDRWRVRFWVLPLMLVESLVVALPLLIISGVFARPATDPDAGLGARLLVALGAGIYEELVYRMLLISGLIWVARRVAELRGESAVWTGVALATLLFAASHFQPIGANPFSWQVFGFTAVAGAYLAGIFLWRGLGIAAGGHAVYNMLLIWLWSGGGGG